MGLFQKNKLKIEKIEKEGTFHYFIDYHKIKDSDKFLMDFIKDFIEDKNCLLVIDMNNFYDRSRSVLENKIVELKGKLDNQGFVYQEVITKKDAENKILGIKIDRSEKVNNYQIGLAVTPDQRRNVNEIIKDYNVFYYIPAEEISTEEISKQFQELRGDYDELEKVCSFHIYNDCYFKRIRIGSREDIIHTIELKLQKYQQ